MQNSTAFIINKELGNFFSCMTTYFNLTNLSSSIICLYVCLLIFEQKIYLNKHSVSNVKNYVGFIERVIDCQYMY